MKAQDLASQVLLAVKPHVVPGVSTFALDTIAAKTLKELGGFSYNKGYHPSWARFPWPTTTCISVNNVIAHGIPSENVILQNGDLCNIDIGVLDQDGNCGDCSFSLGVGDISDKDEILLRYAKKVLYAGISKVKAGAMIGDLVAAMQRVANERNMIINGQMASHYIGKEMHESAFYNAPNPYRDKEKFEEYEKEYMSEKLQAGRILCLEPIITNGKDQWGQIDQNGWELRTRDGAKSAYFEHMIKILPDGYEILTTHFTYAKGDSGRL